MPDITLELYDGSTTVNLVDGTNYNVVPRGIRISVPDQRIAFGGESFFHDGARLAQHAYGPRQISIPLKIIGSSLANLKTQWQAVHQMLEKARDRNLKGFGTQVVLKWQLGTTDANDLTFDVLYGSVTPPPTVMDKAFTNAFISWMADLTLVVQPWAEGAAVTIASDALENFQEGANLNYRDLDSLTTDGPAPCKIKIVQTGETGSVSLYVAKRSGTRQTDDLWTEAEAETAVTVVDALAANWALSNGDDADVNRSGNAYKRVRIRNSTDATAQPDVVPAYLDYDLGASPPKGVFRVLVMTRFQVDDLTNASTDGIKLQWGLGWAFGSHTKAPVAADYKDAGALSAVGTQTGSWTLLDLGLVSIPPISVPASETLSNFSLRIYQRLDAVGSGVVRNAADADVEWHTDYIFLCPADEGLVVISALGSDDVLIDSISDKPGVYLLDNATAAIKGVPTYDGAAFMLGPENSRLYLLRGDSGNIDVVSFAVTGSYIPRRGNF